MVWVPVEEKELSMDEIISIVVEWRLASDPPPVRNIDGKSYWFCLSSDNVLGCVAEPHYNGAILPTPVLRNVVYGSTAVDRPFRWYVVYSNSLDDVTDKITHWMAYPAPPYAYIEDGKFVCQ